MEKLNPHTILNRLPEMVDWVWSRYKIEPISCKYYENINWSLEKREVLDSFFLFVTQGCLEVKLLNKTIDVPAGHILFIPAGETHTLRSKNEGESLHQFALHAHINNIWGEPLLRRCSDRSIAVHNSAGWIENFHYTNLLMHKKNNSGKTLLKSQLKCFLTALMFNGLEFDCSEKVVDKRIEFSLNLINNNIKHDWTVEELSKRVNLGVVQFRKLFLKHSKITPKKYINFRRLQVSCQLLKNTVKQIKEIAYEVGFRSDYYYQRNFKNEMKCTPTEFRNRSWF
jgi:AraC-like DNA-binding protein/mannose-6-phosphate isomerase-like protein (cupin superfamily)